MARNLSYYEDYRNNMRHFALASPKAFFDVKAREHAEREKDEHLEKAPIPSLTRRSVQYEIPTHGVRI